MIPIFVQPGEPASSSPDTIEYVDLFNTIQGEGPFAGIPATFLRLAGCNLGTSWCKDCDTDFTSGRKTESVQEVVKKIQYAADPLHLMGGRGALVVVTGGEPFRQEGLAELVRTLTTCQYKVQIETNGTICPDDFPWYSSLLTVVVSPKTPKIPDDMWDRSHAVKYVVEAGYVDPVDGLPTRVLGRDVRPARPPEHVWANYWNRSRLYVQPAEGRTPEETAANTATAVDTCILYGYRLGLQLHKIVGLK